MSDGDGTGPREGSYRKKKNLEGLRGGECQIF